MVIGGPCAVENEESILKSALGVKAAGGNMLRGGAYKPRTSPYLFQGMEVEGLKLLRKAGDATGLKVVSEIVAQDNWKMLLSMWISSHIGARNTQNFRLLKEVGKSGIPVILKRGIAIPLKNGWTQQSFMSEGNYNVVLCERGIRTFETATRNTLDVGASGGEGTEQFADYY